MGETKIASSKKCEMCGNDYQPTSNAQHFCPECKVKKKNERDRQYRAEKKGNGKARTINSVKTADKTEKDSRVIVDFSRYPAIYQPLCEMADTEFRTVDLQIIAILNDCFKMKETVS